MRQPAWHGSAPTFWYGVVEARDDSAAEDKLKLGRCRVRVYGFHSAELKEDNATGEGIPVTSLHWAYPINSSRSASVSGIGYTPMGPVEGTWVLGMSMDGSAMQDLYILGTLAGAPEKANDTKSGFNDPNKDKGSRPNGPYPLKEFLKESDVNRLARNDSGKRHKSLDDRRTDRITGIKTASGSFGEKATWDEVENSYEARYPYNHVHESESGHLHEIDDTPEHERLHTRHKAGTYHEISEDGSRIQKIVGEDYEIVVENRHAYIKGNLNITVGENANILVEGDCNLEVEKNATVHADNLNVNAKKTMTLTAKDIIILAEASLTAVAGGVLQVLGSNTDPADVSTGIV